MSARLAPNRHTALPVWQAIVWQGARQGLPVWTRKVHMAAMFTVLAFLIAGGAIGGALAWSASRGRGMRQERLESLGRSADFLSTWLVLAMLVALGMAAGARRELLAALPAIGLKAVAVCLFATAGSVLAVRLLLGRGQASEPAALSTQPEKRSFWPPPFSLQTLAAFAGGLLAGRLLGPPPDVPLPDFLGGVISPDAAILHALLLLVGFSAGMDRRTWKTLAAHGPGLLLPPGAALAGSCLGGLAVWPLVGGGLGEVAASAAGMGYYSLTGAMVAARAGEAAGLTALTVNLLRETLTLTAAPWLARRFGPWSVLAAGGATSVDTTLPVLARTCGPAYVAPGVVSGAALSLAAPLVVDFLAVWLAWARMSGFLPVAP